MPNQYPPGYHARRRRIERKVLAWVRTNHPDLWKQAWQAAEAAENKETAE